jgi:cytoskeletal protein RodZ
MAENLTATTEALESNRRDIAKERRARKHSNWVLAIVTVFFIIQTSLVSFILVRVLTVTDQNRVERQDLLSIVDYVNTLKALTPVTADPNTLTPGATNILKCAKSYIDSINNPSITIPAICPKGETK